MSREFLESEPISYGADQHVSNITGMNFQVNYIWKICIFKNKLNSYITFIDKYIHISQGANPGFGKRGQGPHKY